MRPTFSMKISPFYRGSNKNPYEYCGIVIKFDVDAEDDAIEQVVFRTIEKLRRDAKRLTRAAFDDFVATEKLRKRTRTGAPVLSVQGRSALPESERPARPTGTRGMSGLQHTDESRAAISRAIKVRWAATQAADYAGPKMGRLTNLERKERDKRAARHEAATEAEYKRRRAKEKDQRN